MEPVVEKMMREESDYFASAREYMVLHQIYKRGIRHQRVLDAMRFVHRHEFVPFDERLDAYTDAPLPIGFGQTISQPFIVALMTTLADPASSSKVLEIGTGSGYQTAILAYMARNVYSVEAVEELHDRAAGVLHDLGMCNVDLRIANGHFGWVEEAPFDCILVTAAPREVPPELIRQLKPGGRLILPVGSPDDAQSLRIVRKSSDHGLTYEDIAPVKFVPMTNYH